MISKANEDDKLICLKCGYEVDRWKSLQNRKKGQFPACPVCKIELSFKVPELLAEVQHPAVPYIIFFIAVLVGCLGVFIVRQHFKAVDGRRLVAFHAVPGEIIYGGKAKARIPGEWLRMPYSYERYWKADFHSRMDMMIHEEHWYVYQGNRNGVIQIEYDYSDSTGKRGRQNLPVSVSLGRGILVIPAIPYIQGSRTVRLKMTLDPGGGIQVEFL